MKEKNHPDYEDVSNLKYALAIMYETLRLYPIVPQVPKYAPEDTTLGPYFIPKNSFVNFHIQALHYNPKYWGKDVNEFNPDRFLGDYPKTAFIPFSDGARACLGKRFAQIEAVTVLATIVQNYTIEIPEDVDRDHVLDLKMVLKMIPKNPLNLVFKKRV
jgi:cytochrome P450